eukprot:327622-Hanusia_phi.AAC.1
MSEGVVCASFEEVVFKLLQEMKGNSLLDIIWFTDGSYGLEQNEALTICTPLVTAVECFGASLRIIFCPHGQADVKCRENVNEWQDLLQADCIEVSRDTLRLSDESPANESSNELWPFLEEILKLRTEWRGKLLFELRGPCEDVKHACKVQLVRDDCSSSSIQLDTCKLQQMNSKDQVTIYSNLIEILKPVDVSTIPIHFFGGEVNLEFLGRDNIAEKFQNLMQTSKRNMGFLCKFQTHQKSLEHSLKLVSRELLERGCEYRDLVSECTKLDDGQVLSVLHQSSSKDSCLRMAILRSFDSNEPCGLQMTSALIEELKSAAPMGLRLCERLGETEDVFFDSAILKDCVFDLNKNNLHDRMLASYEEELEFECRTLVSTFSSSCSKDRPTVLEFGKGIQPSLNTFPQLSPVQKVNQNHKVPPFPESRDLAAKKIRSAIQKFSSQGLRQISSTTQNHLEPPTSTLVDYSRFCDAFDTHDSDFQPSHELVQGADGIDNMIPMYPKRTHGVDYCFDDWEEVEVELRRVRRCIEKRKDLNVSPGNDKAEGRRGRPGGAISSLPPPAPRVSALQEKENRQVAAAKPAGGSRVSQANKTLVRECMGKKLAEVLDRHDSKFEAAKKRLFYMFYAVYKEDLRAAAMGEEKANELVSDILRKNLDLILR